MKGANKKLPQSLQLDFLGKFLALQKDSYSKNLNNCR